MNLSQLPNVIKTPAGASSSAAGVISLILNVILPPVWPWLAHQSTEWRGGVATVLIFAGSYMGTWWKVVHAKNQKYTMELTHSRLPTVQMVPEPEPKSHSVY